MDSFAASIQVTRLVYHLNNNVQIIRFMVKVFILIKQFVKDYLQRKFLQFNATMV